MATLEAALVAAVIGEETIAARIGDRFFPIGGRQKVPYPYVTYQRITTSGAEYLDGDATLEWPRFQVDTWSPDADEAQEIAEAIRAFLCPTPSVPIAAAGLSFTASFQDQRGPTLDETTRNFGCSQDYFLTYLRS